MNIENLASDTENINQKVRLIVEKDKLIHNYKIAENAAGTPLYPVVKANGYGMGTLFFARTLIECGADTLCVTRIEDAVLLRESGVTKDICKIILLNSYRLSDDLYTAVKYSLVPSIDSADTLLIYNNLCREYTAPCIFQLAIDSGMGRFGFTSANDILSALESIDCGEIDGIYSHFSASFERKNKITETQFNYFLDIINTLENEGIRIKSKHISNSNAIFRFPQYHLTASRPGSALIGRIPKAKKYSLEKVGYLEGDIINIKSLPKGHNIGYGNIYKTKKYTKIAVISAGSADGYSLIKEQGGNRFSDKLSRLKKAVFGLIRSSDKYTYINGKKVKILGRVMVNHVIADITDIDCNIGDTAVFDVNPMFIDSGVTRVYK